MEVSVFSRFPGAAQATQTDGLPRCLTQIVGTRPGELLEPRNLILEAINQLTIEQPVRRKSTAMALKVSGLLYASALAAKALGRRWSTCGCYDPLPDYLTLQDLADTRLPKVRGPNHPITQLRVGIASSIAALRDRPA